MIRPEHPDPERRRFQEQFIAEAPESIRRWNELMFSYRNAINIYKASIAPLEPNKSAPAADDWTNDLPADVAKVMKEGRQEMADMEGFARFVREGTLHKEDNDVVLQEYVRQLMGEKNYQEYRAMDKSF